jgi:hypothetical protein
MLLLGDGVASLRLLLLSELDAFFRRDLDVLRVGVDVLGCGGDLDFVAVDEGDSARCGSHG